MSGQKIASAFFREKQFYNLKTFSERLEIQGDSAHKLILRLRGAGIIKPTTRRAFDMDVLQSEEIISDERFFSSEENGFAFCFVGIACAEQCVLKCLPKYVEHGANGKSFEENPAIVPHFKKVLKAIQKYDCGKSENIYLHTGTEQKERFNRLAMEIHLLEDYFAHGIYTNERETIETNGEGQIDWNKTIGETFAFVRNAKPYYVDVRTSEFRDDSRDFFRLLHECVLTKCSRELQEIGVLDLFDIAPAELCARDFSDFGGIAYIKNRLDAEIKNQFVTRKQNLLKTLRAFLDESESEKMGDSFCFYGTNAFNMVWESACSAIFNDVKNEGIASLERRGILDFKNHARNPKSMKDCDTLESLIEKAKWEFRGNIVESSETLRPDIIAIRGGVFYILDGKYYVPKYEKDKISNQPGIQDVVKQFAYHKAFHHFLQLSSLEKVANAFLLPQTFPNDGEHAQCAGQVELRLMQSFAMETLCPISLVELNPDFVFEQYVQGKKISAALEKIKATPIPKITLSAYDWQHDFIPRLHFTMAGFLRKPYAEQIRSQKKDFVFFFYRKKGEMIYPVHNLLPCCGTFIGYNPDCHFFVKGKIAAPEQEQTIQICKTAELRERLEQCGYKNATQGTADLYYVVKITDVEIADADSDGMEKLKVAIDRFDGNDVLSEHSPKVVGDF
ncbi:MAG: LlaJI family restriction endonuclease [Treponemataceae bacterium]|nr:LlaJI family restriction endonuclease [Treponemataceae bacterium]